MVSLCHRNPERSLRVRGKTLPLCARCTGYYSGLFLGLIVSAFIGNVGKISSTQIVVIMIVATIPMAFDGLSQHFRVRMSNNYLRVSTGFIGGRGSGIGIVWLWYRFVCW